MSIDAELLKQLMVTFKTELDEQTQAIIDSLLLIEKGELPLQNDAIETIFRAAHNIKGTSRSLGVNSVSDIAHRLESVFSAIKKNEITLSKPLVDLCLESVDKMRSHMTSALNNTAPVNDLNELLNNLDKSLKNEFTEKKTTAEKPIESDVHDVIPVSVEKIDKISALLEDIQANKITIEDICIELNELANMTNEFSSVWHKLITFFDNKSGHLNDMEHRLFHSGSDEFENMLSKVNRINKSARLQLNELSLLSNTMQEEVRMLRLVPIANLLYTLPRYVRDLSHQLNKKINLEIKDNNIRIDKFVLERLKHPIIHLLRNAIDHGIESESERLKKGKSATGNILIEIKEESNHIIMFVKDDGAGVDKQQIAATALNKNLLTQEELNALTDADIIDLIFNPGFSTKKEVSDISGRGVGLNVVRENIASLKGKVSIETEKDKYTLFTIRVPISLSSETGMQIKCNGQLFIIPTFSIQRVHTVKQHEIINISGGQAIVSEKKTIPLHSLSSALGLQQTEQLAGDDLSLVVINKDSISIAFLVDEIIGEREIVIKRLNNILEDTPCVSGGALLDRNQVVLVLNPSNLIDAALNTPVVEPVIFHEAAPKKTNKASILVVDDSITTRALEKNILENKNYEVTVAVNGKEAWDILQKRTFSLLITDINMPVMDGFTLTEHVKNSDKLRDLPVIIVTSLNSPAEKTRGLEAGADAYIVKSEFESGALLDIIEQLV